MGIEQGLLDLLTSFETKVDLSGAEMGVSESTMRNVDAGLEGLKAGAENGDIAKVAFGVGVATGVVMFLGPELAATLGAAIVGEGAVVATGAAIDTTIAATYPELAYLASGSSIVYAGTATLGGTIIYGTTQALPENLYENIATGFSANPTIQHGAVTVSGTGGVVITNGGNVTVAANASVTIEGNASITLNSGSEAVFAGNAIDTFSLGNNDYLAISPSTTQNNTAFVAVDKTSDGYIDAKFYDNTPQSNLDEEKLYQSS